MVSRGSNPGTIFEVLAFVPVITSLKHIWCWHHSSVMLSFQGTKIFFTKSQTHHTFFGGCIHYYCKLQAETNELVLKSEVFVVVGTVPLSWVLPPVDLQVDASSSSSIQSLSSGLHYGSLASSIKYQLCFKQQLCHICTRIYMACKRHALIIYCTHILLQACGMVCIRGQCAVALQGCQHVLVPCTPQTDCHLPNDTGSSA